MTADIYTYVTQLSHEPNTTQVKTDGSSVLRNIFLDLLCSPLKSMYRLLTIFSVQ